MAFRSKVAALAAFVVMALVAASGYHSAWAQDADVHPSASTQERPKPAAHASNARASVPNARGEPAGYYVEFRAIDGFIYGHTVIAYGRLNARGQPIEEHYAGFEPDGGSIGAAFGHVMPVSGSIKTSRESVISRSSIRIAAGLLRSSTGRFWAPSRRRRSTPMCGMPSCTTATTSWPTWRMRWGSRRHPT